jgi:Flp pilus assembly protein TadB
MSTPSNPEKPAPGRSNAERIAVLFVVGVLLFGVLWYTVFTAVTAALVSAGVTGVLVIGSSASDTLEALVDMLANILAGILAAIAAVLAAIFSIFN